MKQRHRLKVVSGTDNVSIEYGNGELREELAFIADKIVNNAGAEFTPPTMSEVIRWLIAEEVVYIKEHGKLRAPWRPRRAPYPETEAGNVINNIIRKTAWSQSDIAAILLVSRQAITLWRGGARITPVNLESLQKLEAVVSSPGEELRSLLTREDRRKPEVFLETKKLVWKKLGWKNRELTREPRPFVFNMES